MTDSADGEPVDGEPVDGEPVDGDPIRGRVLCDAMCGTLATHLRMCGYDAAYALDRGVEDDDRLLALAAAEDRRLITRDRELARRADRHADAPDGVLLTERDVTDQLRELRDAGFEIALADRPRRCGRCNGRVERGDDAARPDYVPNDVTAWRCRDCGQWFWKGSHWTDVRERLEGI